MRVRAIQHVTTWLMALLLLTACRVVDLDSSGKPIIPADPSAGPDYSNQTPQQIAQEFWAPKILPVAHAQALDWAALKQTQGQLAAGQTKSVYSQFFAKISAIDADGMQRKLTLNVNGEVVILQLGPIIQGNAVRDAAGFIHFDDFKNQVQFARIARALNVRAISGLPPLDATWVGQPVDVLAAFTLSHDSIDDGVALEITRGTAQ
jgi:predicted lipoprotein